MNKFFSKLKEWNKKDLLSLILPGYKVNKWIFRAALLLIFVFGVWIIASNGFDFSSKVYVHCPNNSFQGFSPPCDNPFSYSHYDAVGISRSECPDDSLCSIDTFLPGQSYGRKFSHWVSDFPVVVLVIFIVAFVFNHYQNNRGYKRPEVKS